MGRLWFIEQMGVWTKLVCTHILQDGKMAVTLWFCCADGCVYKNNLYPLGATWEDGCDFDCQCIDGTTGLYQCTAKWVMTHHSFSFPFFLSLTLPLTFSLSLSVCMFVSRSSFLSFHLICLCTCHMSSLSDTVRASWFISLPICPPSLFPLPSPPSCPFLIICLCKSVSPSSFRPSVCCFFPCYYRSLLYSAILWSWADSLCVTCGLFYHACWVILVFPQSTELVHALQDLLCAYVIFLHAYMPGWPLSSSEGLLWSPHRNWSCRNVGVGTTPST